MLKEISVILPQVLYHMFEAYVEMGAENVGASEVAKGFASFAVVAIGGTIIGISKGHLRCIFISARLREPTLEQEQEQPSSRSRIKLVNYLVRRTK